MHFNYLEMKYLVFYVTLNLLFFANIVSSTVSVVAQYDDKLSQTKKFEIKQALQLSCNVTTDDSDSNKNLEVTWYKSDQVIAKNETIKKRLSLSHKNGIYKLQINSAEEEDGGAYACAVSISGEEVARANITVESKIYVKLPRDISVIEGEKLHVTCIVHGNPTPHVVWIYNNVTYEKSTDRILILEDTNKNIPNAIFSIEEITMEDKGELRCRGLSKITNETSESVNATIRIKDKYAALWPFLGICAEVLVLCAVILIYEKKRNKTELEESDTDQSPEQKNTPDHGGKESNLRHRQ